MKGLRADISQANTYSEASSIASVLSCCIEMALEVDFNW